MNTENLFKSWFTTLLGAGILLVVMYEIFVAQAPRLTRTEAIWVAIAGFALMFMKDAISGWINQAVTAAIDKFSGGKKDKDTTNPG